MLVHRAILSGQRGSEVTDDKIESGVAPPTVPEYYQWNHDVSRAFQSKTVLIRLDPDTPDGQRSSGRLRWTLPNDTWYDFRMGYITFRFTSEAGGVPTFLRMSRYVWTVIKKQTLRLGATEVEQIDKANLIRTWHRLFMQTTDMQYQDVLLFGGSISDIVRGNQAAGWKFSIPIFFNALTEKPLPLHLSKDRWTLEFNLDNAANCLETDGTDPNFTVSDYRLWFHRVRPSEAFDNMFKDALSKGPIYLKFDTYLNHEFIANATTTTFSQPVNERSTNITSIVVIARDMDTLTDPSQLGKFDTMNFNDLDNYQFRINGELYPPDPVDGSFGIEPWMHLANCMGFWNSYDGDATVWHPSSVIASDVNTDTEVINYTAQKFSIYHNFEEHPHTGLVSGIDMTAKNGVILFQQQWGTPLAANQQIDLFVKVTRILILKPDGSHILIK
jgi:hypothetical protein